MHESNSFFHPKRISLIEICILSTKWNKWTNFHEYMKVKSGDAVWILGRISREKSIATRSGNMKIKPAKIKVPTESEVLCLQEIIRDGNHLSAVP